MFQVRPGMRKVSCRGRFADAPVVGTVRVPPCHGGRPRTQPAKGGLPATSCEAGGAGIHSKRGVADVG